MNEKWRSNKFLRLECRTLALLSAPLWAFSPCGIFAGPSGGQIVGGSGSIARPNATLTEIHQDSARLAIDWQQFDVNANEVVKFLQPSASAVALNRILDTKSSLILGRIEANGRIFLINPRGIVFGKGATVNVAGLVASSLDIDPNDFMKGNFLFGDKGGDGVVVNQGTIEAAVGGAVVLLGKVVVNEGDIRAPQGSAQLISAGGAVITFDENDQLGVQITAEQAQRIANQTDAVRNSGTISAEGGYIALTGATTADLFTNAVNNEGVLVANSVRNHNGVIELSGGSGNVAQNGEVNVSAIADADNNASANGGDIRITGNSIRNNGKLIADGENGGTIALRADDLILTQSDAQLSATGNAGNGGHIELMGDRVGVMDRSRIDVSGTNGGGVVHIGGAFHGENDGTGPRNAQRTVVDDGVSIFADATQNGNGGEVVLWSDDVTYFGGKIFARGGINGGDGGNIETSGKQSLNFTGYVDTSAPKGKMGNLLLDPAVINIIDGSGGAQDAGVADGIINSGDAPSPYQVSEQALEALTTSVTLNATQQINIANLTDNLLLFHGSSGSGDVTFNISSTGNTGFTMADVNDEIRVNNGNLIISSVSNNGSGSSGTSSLTLGKLTTTGSGNISLTASSTCSTNISCSSGAVTVSTGAINAVGSVTVQGTASVTTPNSGAASSNVTMTLGDINAGTTVTVSGKSDSNSTNSTANSGTASVTIGHVVAAGAVSLRADSTGTRGFGTPTTNATTVTVQDISITGNAPLQIISNSQYNNSSENIYIGGNYIDNGGNITIDGYTLNLTNNTVIDTTGTITLTYTVLNTTPYTLTQGAINDIYVGDISGSAGAGDLGFSQTDIANFAGSGLVLSAKNNIFLGNATITSPSATSVQLIADNDSSGAGDISIASGKTFDLNGRNLIASGANATINGSIVNSGTGSQQITTTGAISMGSGATLTSGSGNISLNAGTSLTMASNASITSTSGQLALTAANNIALGSLSTGNATTNAVNVTSTSGSIGNAGAATNILASAAGSRVALNAVSGIAAALSIANLSLTNSGSGTVSLTDNRALQISSFTNTPATTASITTTGGGSDITIAGSVSSGSDLTFISSGAFTVNNGNTVNANAGTLSINAAGNAAITGLTTTNNTASAITVISGGAITDNGDINTDITATQPSAVVTLQAANGIGNGNAIDFNATTLSVSNGASGNIQLHALGTYTFGAIDNSASAGGAVSLSSDGNLTANDVTTNNGAITLSAFDNVTLAPDAALQSSGGNVAITADTNANNVGAITMNSGTINAGSGTIALNAAQNITLNQLTTTNATTSAVTITSTIGKILGNFDGTADITATSAGSRVNLNAATGIDSGGSNALELAVANVSATNSTSGGINLTNNRALQISSLTNTPATATSITTTGGGSDITIAGNVSSGSNLTLTSSGGFTVNSGATVNSNAGTLSINATGDAAITGLSTTNNTASAVSVISGGAIIDNGNAANDITATGASAMVTLQAANGIGAANALDLSVANLSLTNTAANAINITNNRALQINAVVNIPATSTTIATTGVGSNMTVASNIASGSDVSLTSSGTFTLNGGNTINPNTGAVMINSAGNAAINGSVISLGASAQQITSTGGAISMGSGATLASASGNILLNAGTGITMASDASIASASGQLSLTAANNIALGALSTSNGTASAVNITSTAGAISNAGAATNILANAAGSRVGLHAASGINAALSIADLALTNSTSGTVSLTNNRALQISSLTNTPATASSITTTGIGSDITIAGNVSNGGNLTLTSSGAFTVNDGNTVNSNAGTLAISATGNAAITGLQSSNNTASAVSVISGGAITDNGDTNLDITATQPNAVVTLQAANGIGSANALDLSVSRLALTNTTANAINITNNRALQINAVTNTPATSTTIATTGAGSNMTVAGNIASGSDISLTSSGTFAMTDGFTINPTAGTIAINATGNAAITGLTTTNNSGGAISVVSGGAITDAGDTNADVNATQAGAIITLQAASGIGNGNAIDINGQVAATNGSSGDIGLHMLGSYTFGAIDNSASAGGAVALSSDGNLTANNVTTNNGAITLSAFDNVTLAPGAALQSSGGDIAITADTNANNVGAITMNSATINAGSGTIALNAAQNITLNQLTTTNATTSAVTITSTIGKILGNFDGTADITATSAGSRVNLNAATGIDSGGGNALELAVANVSATNTTSGGINLTNNRALQISALTNTPATAVTITTTGATSDLTVAGATSSGGTLSLTSGRDMSIAGNISSGSDLTLLSSGTFGVTVGNTVNSSAGTLTINSAGNAVITGLTTANNTASAISVISGGAITDAGADNIADITTTGASSVVTLQAANGIGSANAIDLNLAGQVTANNTAGGDIGLHALNSYTFGTMTNGFATGSVALSSDGNLTANDVTTNNGAITLSAFDNVTLAPGAALQSSGGDIAITADTNANNVGAITMNSGTINAGSGTIALNAAQNINLNQLTTTNATTGAVTIASTIGKILGNFDGTADITATSAGSRVNLNAATGIDSGGSNALELAVANVSATNTTSGGINLTNNRALQISALTNTPATAVTITTTGATSDLTVAGATSSGGTLSLTSGRDMSIAGNISSGSNLTLASSGAFTVNNGNTVNSNAGTLSINATGDAAITGLSTTNNTASAVSVISGGAIIDNGNAANDITATGASAVVTLQAANGVGAANALDLSIGNLSLINSTGGAVNASNNRSLQINSFANNGSGDVALTVTGANNDLTFAGTLQNNGGNVALTATRNIDLQNVANANALSTNSAVVNYAQSIAAGSITSAGTANVAGDLTTTAGNIDLQTVVLGAGPHAFRSATNADINLGAVSGNSDLQLASGGNITLAGAALGGGNFTASSGSQGIFTANGDVTAAVIALDQFSTINAMRMLAASTSSLTANTINLGGDLQSGGAMTLTGTTQLQNDVLLTDTGSGNLLQLNGSVVGNNHQLSIAAANNTVCIACATGSSASGLAGLDVQGSIKSVLGDTSVNGNAVINADQEIYLNGDTAVTGNLDLLADANGDGVGIAALLSGKNLNVGGAFTVRPIALSSITAAAQCASPTGLPQMPSSPPPVTPPPVTPPPVTPSAPDGPVQPAVITNNDVVIAIQESGFYELATNSAMLRNVPQIEYLSNNCQDADKRKSRAQCDVDASMFDFLGTFLIDNQIPNNGSGQ